MKLRLTLLSIFICLQVSAQTAITTFAGRNIHSFYNGAPATAAQFNAQHKIRFANGLLYIADASNNSVRVLDPATNNITIFAGRGSSNFSGDGMPATAAEMNYPQSVCIDDTGNIYIADCWGHRIRKTTPSGIITTVAGNGIAGYSGDGGPATAAQFNKPQSVATDDSGNIYIADFLNNVIRKVDLGGNVSTIAGIGVTGNTGDGGPATSALLNKPMDLFLDTANNIYFADQGNHSIRVIRPNGIIQTIAGTGMGGYSGDGGPATAAKLQSPYAVMWHPSGYLYVADYGNHRVRNISLSTGIINTVAGNGTAGNSGDGGFSASAQLQNPAGVAMDNTGNLFITSGSRIRKVSPTGIITTIAGNEGYGGDGGRADTALLQNPMHVCRDAAGNTYIADSGSHTVRKVNGAGIITTIAGNGIRGNTGDNGPATAATLNQPVSVAINSIGYLYISDKATHVIRMLNTATGIITTVAGTGGPGYSGNGGQATTAQMNNPYGIAVDTADNLYVADNVNNCIRRIDAATGIITAITGAVVGGFSGDGAPAIAASINGPVYITFDRDNNLYIADKYNNRIRKVNGSTGYISTVFGNGTGGDAGDGGTGVSAELCEPTSVAVDDSGGITTYVCGKIRHVPTSGGPVRLEAGMSVSGISADGLTGGQVTFDTASGIAYDEHNNLLIPDVGNHCVRMKLLPFTLSVAPVTKQAGPITISPNPVRNTFSISMTTPDGVMGDEMNVSIRDVLGKIVYSSAMLVHNNKALSTIRLSDDLAAGVYFCTITGPGIRRSASFALVR